MCLCSQLSTPATVTASRIMTGKAILRVVLDRCYVSTGYHNGLHKHREHQDNGVSLTEERASRFCRSKKHVCGS